LAQAFRNGFDRKPVLKVRTTKAGEMKLLLPHYLLPFLIEPSALGARAAVVALLRANQLRKFKTAAVRSGAETILAQIQDRLLSVDYFTQVNGRRLSVATLAFASHRESFRS
jgi:hypothetical protein